MPRQKKEYSPVSLKMNKTVFERLCAYSNESGVPKTTIIERAVTKYIEDKEKLEVGTFLLHGGSDERH